MFVILAVSAVPLSASAGQNRESVSVSVAPDSLYVGERVVCTVRVRHSGSTAVALFPPDTTASDFLLPVARRQVSSKLASGLFEERIELEFAAFGSGMQQLPEFGIEFRDKSADRVVRRRYFHEPARVFVKTLSPKEMQELRPLKPPRQPAFPLLFGASLLLAVLALVAALLLVLFFIRRKTGHFAQPAKASHVASRKLHRLKNRLSGDLSPMECYAELSSIMREYLERHYRIRALEAVTREIECDLSRLGVSSFDSIVTLLRQADLVKFADSRPSVEESRNSILLAEKIVQRARNDVAGHRF